MCKDLLKNQSGQFVDSTDMLAVDTAIVEILKNFQGKATAARVYMKIKWEHPNFTSKDIGDALGRISS